MAIQAVETLIHVDLAALLDRTDRTDSFAVTTRVAALRMAAQPLEHADAADDRKASSTSWAKHGTPNTRPAVASTNK